MHGCCVRPPGSALYAARRFALLSHIAESQRYPGALG